MDKECIERVFMDAGIRLGEDGRTVQGGQSTICGAGPIFDRQEFGSLADVARAARGEHANGLCAYRRFEPFHAKAGANSDQNHVYRRETF